MTKNLIATAILLMGTIGAQLALVGAQMPSNLNQTHTGIHGSVTDPSGAVIPGAMVTISSGAFGRTVSTDDNGQYSLSGVEPGHYRVRVHFGGFALFDRSNFVVAAGHETEANTQLEVKESRQTVTVYE